MKKFFIFGIIAFVLGFGLAAAYHRYGNQHALGRLVVTTAENQITKDAAWRSLLDSALGFKGPKTYLVLLLNNTELRPGGGFIGAYALVKMDNGHPDLIKIEGTEVFDGQAKTDRLLDPPPILKQYLKVNHWFFRDSNWSPDYAESAKQALDFYKRENGYLSNQIDGVVAFTPTVLAEFLAINGPVTVDGFTFDKNNVIEKLEYEVEYGYVDRGISFSDRKKLMSNFGIALVKQAKLSSFWKIGEYLAMAQKMFNERHILFYSIVPSEQANLERLGWAGRVSQTNSDYLIYVDANLGALKTDAALKRELTYSFAPSSTGQIVAKATMRYQNAGKKDWRTTRYRTYARVYAPLGSFLVGVSETVNNKVTELPADQGVELGHAWFGVEDTVDLDATKEITFTYLLPGAVSAAIKNGEYKLQIQKQLGTDNYPLTLSLDFGRTIKTATPVAPQKDSEKNKYYLKTILETDKQFTVSF